MEQKDIFIEQLKAMIKVLIDKNKERRDSLNTVLEIVIRLFNKINSSETNKIEYTDEEVKEIAEVLREV